jgi:hypothetical protein
MVEVVVGMPSVAGDAARTITLLRCKPVSTMDGPNTFTSDARPRMLLPLVAVFRTTRTKVSSGEAPATKIDGLAL